jgi:pyrimidine deaminase RibD-like protein
LVLAVESKEQWLLLHASVILVGPSQGEFGNPPVPEQFLYLVEERDVDTLQSLIDELESENSITIGEKKVIIKREKSSNWWTLPAKTGIFGHKTESEGGTILRFEGASLSKILKELEFNPNTILKQFPIRPYEGLHDFGRLLVGASLDETRLVNVDIIAPTWTSIKDVSLDGDSVSVKLSCPEAIFDNTSITLSIEGEELPIQSSTMGDLRKNAAEIKQFNGMKHSSLIFKSIIDQESLSSWLRATVAASYESDVLLASKNILLSEEKPDTNPNNVQRYHFERAVELAGECVPEGEKKSDDVPKVGAVIVKNGEIISQAFRGQIGSGDHAEYIALEEKGVDKTKFIGSDLITTLEPCTKRGHGKGKLPCVEWIIKRRIRKVWIGSLDLNYDIRGIGEIKLLEASIAVGRFPYDDLVNQTIKQNKAFFDKIQQKPRVPLDELHSTIRDLQNAVANHFENLFPMVENYHKQHIEEYFKPSRVRLFWSSKTKARGSKSWSDLKRGWHVINILKDISSELDMAELHDASYWCKLGGLFIDAHISYLVPFDKDLAGSEPFTRSIFDTLYKDRDRWEISSDTAYDRTGQPVTDGSLESWMKHRRFPIGPAWKVFNTAIDLDSQSDEAWLGRAKVELLKRRFEQCHSSLERAFQIRKYDVSGAFVPAEEIIGFDVEATYRWLAKLIDIDHTTIAFPIIPIELHRIQLHAILRHIQIHGSLKMIGDVLFVLLKRPLSFDNSEDIQVWKEIEKLSRELGFIKTADLCISRIEKHGETEFSEEDEKDPETTESDENDSSTLT